MSEEALKLEIINRIMALKDSSKLKKIEATLREMWSDDITLEKLNKPMRKTLDIEQLKKEQNFKPVDKKEFFKKIDELDIQESIDDLIEMI